MLISLSRSTSNEHWTHKHFYTEDFSKAHDFAHAITKHHWSPIIWIDGERLSKKYFSCGLCVFDFDDGALTLDAARELFTEAGLFHVIGTTKSHQIAKDGKPAVDRFRVVLKFDAPIMNKDQYVQNMRRLAKNYPCDQNALDAARKFAPCREIVAIEPGGAVYVEKLQPIKERWIPRSFYIPEERKIPPWIKEILTQGIAPGERNQTLYRVCANLRNYGFPIEETLAIIAKSNIDLTDSEVQTIAKSAYR